MIYNETTQYTAFGGHLFSQLHSLRHNAYANMLHPLDETHAQNPQKNPRMTKPTQNCTAYQDCQKAIQSYQELPRAAHSYPELTRAAKSYPELPKAAQSFQELNRAAKSMPELPKGTKNYT